VILVGEHEQVDARLLVDGEVACEIAEALEHPLGLGAPPLGIVGLEKILLELPVVVGELAFESRDLLGIERGEDRSGVLRRLGGELAVARAHVVEPPGDVVRGDAAGGALARAAHQLRVGRHFGPAVPLVEARDALAHVLGLRRIELEVARGHEAQRGVGVVVRHSDRAARGEQRASREQGKAAPGHQ
jgi:hypothetical protein